MIGVKYYLCGKLSSLLAQGDEGEQNKQGKTNRRDKHLDLPGGHTISKAVSMTAESHCTSGSAAAGLHHTTAAMSTIKDTQTAAAALSPAAQTEDDMHLESEQTQSTGIASELPQQPVPVSHDMPCHILCFLPRAVAMSYQMVKLLL